MKWEKMDEWYLKSDTGEHVSKAYVETLVRYSAWNAAGELLGVYDTAQEARDKCEQSNSAIT